MSEAGEMSQSNRPYAVCAEHLTVKFGEFKAVNDISFSVRPGEIFGFLGANGAGKTTTIRVLCGLLTPTEGKVELGGLNLNAQNATLVKSRVGYMSQKFTLYSDMTVGENLEFAAHLRKIPGPVYRQRQKELLGFIGFEKPLTTLVSDLPGGMKQQVSLASSLLHDPDVVFLDEPTAGVSPASRAVFWELIHRISSSGKTIFVTSHYMDEVEQCGRIALMRSGEIIALDSPEDLKKNAFPSQMYELTPTGDVSREAIQSWRRSEIFESFEPYGLHYHVTVANPSAWRQFQAEHQADIIIREIKPSLEDVFIHMVEGQNR